MDINFDFFSKRFSKLKCMDTGAAEFAGDQEDIAPGKECAFPRDGKAEAHAALGQAYARGQRFDEAYAQFADWSALSLLDEERPMVVVRTFSKTWSMAAARLGYVVAPTWVVNELEKVILPYHLDTAKQIAGRLALTFVHEMEERVRFVVSERERLSAAMARLPVDVFPSGANFVLFRPRSMRGRDVWQCLLDRSVLVRDCSGWPRLADCLRVTIGTRDENDAFLAALQEVLS